MLLLLLISLQRKFAFILHGNMLYLFEIHLYVGHGEKTFFFLI